jgi:hypothetical protein
MKGIVTVLDPKPKGGVSTKKLSMRKERERARQGAHKDNFTCVPRVLSVPNWEILQTKKDIPVRVMLLGLRAPSQHRQGPVT